MQTDFRGENFKTSHFDAIAEAIVWREVASFALLAT
jgi:hypothetical protein